MAVSYDLEGQRRAYRVWARMYDRVYLRLLAPTQRKAVAAAAAAGRDILEIGVGTGLTLPYFPAHCRVLGVDLSEDMLRVAQAKVMGQGLAHVIGLAAMDACRLAVPREAFDAVTAQFVLTLVPDPEGALDEMDGALKPGGELIVASRLVESTGAAARFWSLVAPLARAVGWSSDFKVARVTDWAAGTGRYTVLEISGGYFKMVRLRKNASARPAATVDAA